MRDCIRTRDCQARTHFGDCKSMPTSDRLTPNERTEANLTRKALADGRMHVHRNRAVALLAALDRIAPDPDKEP